MATTINSNTTDGIIITPDLSGEIELQSDGVTKAKITSSGLTDSSGNSFGGMRNRIINGDFSVAQRGTSFTSGANDDDAYTLDRWYILSDGNDAIDVTQETSVVPTNGLHAIGLDVETVNKKFGIAQIIEQKNCVGLIGNTVTLSFKAKVSATTKLDNVKCAIVSWSGTADTVTSDIVSAWGAEGTNPTLIANATYENTPANLNVTTSYATYSVTANVDTASTKNIIVFIWSDVTDTTAGDFLYITDVQLEQGAQATSYEQKPYDVELNRCLRYYFKHAYDGSNTIYGVGHCRSNYMRGVLHLPIPMRTNPTMSNTGTDADYELVSGGVDYTSFVQRPTRDGGSPYVVNFRVQVSSLTNGHAAIITMKSTSSYLAFSAEL